MAQDSHDEIAGALRLLGETIVRKGLWPPTPAATETSRNRWLWVLEEAMCAAYREAEQERLESELDAVLDEPHKRKAIPGSVREWIMLRDSQTCRHCGSKEGLAIDHIIPVSKGGTNDEDNLQVLCGSCNSRKGARVDG